MCHFKVMKNLSPKLGINNLPQNSYRASPSAYDAITRSRFPPASNIKIQMNDIICMSQTLGKKMKDSIRRQEAGWGAQLRAC